ncbi:MAG: SIMPL domain-containing protein [Phyllobacteriaceae bacterium]|nr:SIMPL domain-containing protein [Phyllobacteriaceae bacterium]
MQGLLKLLAAVVLAIGVAASGWLAGSKLVESRTGLRTVTVKGLAERNVKADLGFWPLRFVATGPTLEEARIRLESSEQAVSKFLADRGFKPADAEIQNILVEDKLAGYNSGEQPAEIRFVLTEDILVRSTDVELLAKSAREIGELLKSGVVFTNDSWSAGPSYIFTKINDLKAEMLSEAIKRAKETAATFASESGGKVGAIQTANQGVFEILPAIAIPNDRPEKQIDKTVRVVTTITYFLAQ